MAESTLSIVYSELQREVGRFLGWSRDPTDWSTDQTTDFGDILKSGLRMFYRPPPLEEGEPRHEWSFLGFDTTLALSSSDYDYDLPDDFGTIVSDSVTYGVGDGKRRLRRISDSELRSLQSQNDQSGDPKYYAIEAKQHAPTTGQRYQMLVYPTPSGSLTLSYAYNVLPDTIDSTNIYPLGGSLYSETILAAVLAAAEEKIDDDPSGVNKQKFLTSLANSIKLDKEKKENDRISTWPQGTAPSYGSYDYLLREVGIYLGYGSDQNGWADDEFNKVDTIVQRGVRRFYSPPRSSDGRIAHEWNFLRPLTTITTKAPYSTGTVTVASGVVTLTGGTFPSDADEGEITVDGATYTVNTRDSGTQLTLDDTTVTVASASTYEISYPRQDLPSDFADLESKLTYQPGAVSWHQPIEIVAESLIRARRQLSEYTYRPEFAAIRPKALDATTGTRYEIMWWPVPDGAYILDYRYRVHPGLLTTTNKFPYGGQPHLQTVVSGVLAEAEITKTGSPGPLEARFLQHLQGSIDHDNRVASPDYMGQMRDLSESAVKDRLASDWHYFSNAVVQVNGVAY